MSLSRAPARDTSETPSPRERIRSHMKMVISQLEGILIELKDVAKELREVRFKSQFKHMKVLGSFREDQGRKTWRQGERGAARWVCFWTRLYLIKCKISLAAWRLWLRFESDEIWLFLFLWHKDVVDYSHSVGFFLFQSNNSLTAITNALHVFSGVLWEVQ